MNDAESRWAADPRPSADEYDARWCQLAESGTDLHGEADFVMSYRPQSVLDAGCGTGRVAIELARRGVEVVGVDLDRGLLEGAQRKAPTLSWHHGDLATFDLGRTFDLVVLAGNVMIFLAVETEALVLANLTRHLVPGGLIVAGFQIGRGRLSLAQFDEHAGKSGLAGHERFASWDRDPYRGGDYAVSVLKLTEPAGVSAHSG